MCMYMHIYIYIHNYIGNQKQISRFNCAFRRQRSIDQIGHQIGSPRSSRNHLSRLAIPHWAPRFLLWRGRSFTAFWYDFWFQMFGAGWFWRLFALGDEVEYARKWRVNQDRNGHIGEATNWSVMKSWDPSTNIWEFTAKIPVLREQRWGRKHNNSYRYHHQGQWGE